MRADCRRDRPWCRLGRGLVARARWLAVDHGPGQRLQADAGGEAAVVARRTSTRTWRDEWPGQRGATLHPVERRAGRHGLSSTTVGLTVANARSSPLGTGRGRSTRRRPRTSYAVLVLAKGVEVAPGRRLDGGPYAGTGRSGHRRGSGGYSSRHREAVGRAAVTVQPALDRPVRSWSDQDIAGWLLSRCCQPRSRRLALVDGSGDFVFRIWLRSTDSNREPCG